MTSTTFRTSAPLYSNCLKILTVCFCINTSIGSNAVKNLNSGALANGTCYAKVCGKFVVNRAFIS